MSKLPNFASNLKYWRLINKLVFGEKLCCPGCSLSLAENYRSGYLWCKVCRKKYRATAWRSSWLYGMKIKPRQLFILLWCWQTKKSTEATVLAAAVSYRTLARWQARFRIHLPDTLPMLGALVQVDESYFGKRKSKQAQVIVTGAIEPFTKQLALRITGDYRTGRSKQVLERFIQDAVTPGSLVISDRWYGYDELELLGYGHESHNHAKGDFSSTNQAENIWSVTKRHQRKLTGGKILTNQLPELCKEWMARANQPELFKCPIEFLRFTLVPC